MWHILPYNVEVVRESEFRGPIGADRGAGSRVGWGARSCMKSGVSSFPEKSADDGILKKLSREREIGGRWRWWKVEESGGRGL